MVVVVRALSLKFGLDRIGLGRSKEQATMVHAYRDRCSVDSADRLLLFLVGYTATQIVSTRVCTS